MKSDRQIQHSILTIKAKYLSQIEFLYTLAGERTCYPDRWDNMTSGEIKEYKIKQILYDMNNEIAAFKEKVKKLRKSINTPTNE